MVHKAEESKNVSHIRLELVPFPGSDGDEIPFMDFHHLLSQKSMALPFENHDCMHMLMMFKGREASLFHLEIAELYRKIRFVIKKNLFGHIPENAGIFLVNVGLNAVPSVFVLMKSMYYMSSCSLIILS